MCQETREQEHDPSLTTIKGVVFDLDGTFYVQARLRVLMAGLVLLHLLVSPRVTMRRVRVIRAYRRAQEELRNRRSLSGSGPEEQYALTVAACEESGAFVRETISSWFEAKPLPFLPLCQRRGIRAVLEEFKVQGIRLGVLSDYPAAEKLKALGIDKYFNAVVTPADPEVSGFKPWSNGFAVIAARMGLEPTQMLYVGDRPEVDGLGASRAGMEVAIIGCNRGEGAYPVIAGFAELPAQVRKRREEQGP